MRENMSLLSFWGLIFSLIAVTLFVVIYSYKKVNMPIKILWRICANALWTFIWQQGHVKLRLIQKNSEGPLMK